MKQLFVNGKATTLFFEDTATTEDICDWLSINAHTGNDMINLNEPHTAKFESDGDTIFVSGDEDSLEVTWEYIIPIKLYSYGNVQKH